MRISDWSSDVCSSDLEPCFRVDSDIVKPFAMRRQGMPNRVRCHTIPWLFRMVRDTARSAVHERRAPGRGKRWSEPPKREIELQHARARKTNGGKRRGLAAATRLTLGRARGLAAAARPARTAGAPG